MHLISTKQAYNNHNCFIEIPAKLSTNMRNVDMFVFSWSFITSSLALTARTAMGSASTSSTTCNEGNGPDNYGGRISDDLEKQVVDLFNEAATLPLSLSRDNGNIEVRTKFDGQSMISLAEVKLINQPPSAFKGYLENFNNAFAEADPMVKEVRHLEIDESDSHKREGIKAFLKFPSPISDRVMVHWKYLKLNRNKEDDHLMILSEKNNEKLLSEYLTEEEKKKYVLARTFLCAYWVKPVRDVKDNVIGSTIRYVYSGDVGGSMPERIQRWVAPKNALNSVKGIIGYGQKILGSQ